MKFWKRFQILKGLHRLKSFQSYQKHSEKEFTVLVYLMTEPILKECFKISEFYFRDWGKNPSQLDTMELTDRDTLCTGRDRTRGTVICNAPTS